MLHATATPWHLSLLSKRFNHTNFYKFCISGLCNIINVKGRWLEDSGFMTRMSTTVTVEHGWIIIETHANFQTIARP
ncbi:SymE family type I addiction module toxin [Pectobacterium polaris]|uniref:SymE family type I addiction module toxin n=1 Tax=Pectobacterium polaris TaxID=2042057 RepID=UPI0032E3ACB2